MEQAKIFLADTSETIMQAGNYLYEKHQRPDGVVPFRPERLKLLLSYHYFKKVDLFALMNKYFGDKTPMIFIDSGGFSAATQGVDINIDEYIEFLKKHESIISVKANLDVIGNAEKTYEQQKYIESKGVRPIPVFHTGESLDWLNRYIDEGYEYIALGGMVGYARDKKKLISWMSACFNLVEKRGVKVGFHGFGMTNWDLMRAYPWKSVDSSSWCSGFRYGQVYLFDDKLGRFLQVGLRDIKGSYKHKLILERNGFNPNDIALNSEFDRVKIATISALAFLRAEEFLNKERRGLLRAPKLTPSLHGNGEHQRSGAASTGQPELLADRGSVSPTRPEAVFSPDKLNGEAISRPRGSRDGGRSGESDESGVYLVTIPPKEGSEHNPESKFVGGTQMFESFKNITGGNDE